MSTVATDTTKDEPKDIETTGGGTPPSAEPVSTPETTASQLPLNDPISRAKRVLGVINDTNQDGNQETKQDSKKDAPGAVKNPKDNASDPGKQPGTDKTDPQPAFNVLQWLKETHNIELTSEDDFKKRLSAFDELKTITEQRNQFEAKLKETAEQLEKSKIEDPYVLKLHDLRKNGATTEQLRAFNFVNELGDISTLGDADKIKLQLTLEKGYTEKQADAYIRRYFNLEAPDANNFEAPEDFDAAMDEFLLAEAEVKDKVRSAEKFLNGYIASANDPLAGKKQEQLDQQKAHEAYIKQVEALAPKIAEQFSTLTVNLNPAAKEGEDARAFDFGIADDFKKEIPNLLVEYYKNTNTKLDEDGIKSGLTYVQAMAKSYQYDRDVAAAYAHGASTREAELRAEYDRNGSFVRSTTQPSDRQESAFETWRRKKLTGQGAS